MTTWPASADGSRISCQLKMLVAACPDTELTWRRRPDTCGCGTDGLDRWSCCSNLWIEYDLPSFTSRHTTTSIP